MSQPQARTFEAQQVTIDITEFPHCTSMLVVQFQRFFIKREERKIEDENVYVYFATEQQVGNLDDDARSIAYGTKDGTCQMGLTPREINRQCGFEEYVLKHCFQVRGKEKKVPLQKPGFDPKKKGPYQWKIPALANHAFKHCDV